METSALGVSLVIISALIGALIGPIILEWQRRRSDRELRIQIARQKPYVDFAVAVEQVQLDLDLLISGRAVENSLLLSHFRMMEEARSWLDLEGTQSVRVWAYRCRISITKLCTYFEDHDRRSHFRTKLHEARSAFVKHARAEVGLVKTPTAPVPVDNDEDLGSAHEQWLEVPYEIEDVEAALGIVSTEFGSWKIPQFQDSRLKIVAIKRKS